MDATSTFHTREYHFLKSKSHDTDTPTYMEALSFEHADEYYKAMNDEVHSLMRSYTWDIVSRKSVADKNMITGTWYFKCKRKPYLTIRKFKARYCVRGDAH